MNDVSNFYDSGEMNDMPNPENKSVPPSTPKVHFPEHANPEIPYKFPSEVPTSLPIEFPKQF